MKTFNLLFLSFISILSFAQQITLPRFPAISADGEKLAFSYQGDIWICDKNGDSPQRLTIHEAYESFPVWAPDGKSIAYSSTRNGNNDIFVSELNGRAPQRITYHSSGDLLSDWDTSGHLWFSGVRNYRQIEREQELFSIPASGGTPIRATDALGYTPSVSPDGNLIAFVRGECRVEREDYDGPANKNVWVWNKKTNAFFRITTSTKNDFLPKWYDNSTLYYISGESGRYNIHKSKIKSTGEGEINTQITQFKDFGIRYFDVADKFVFERKNGMFTSSLDGFDIHEVSIRISGDYRFDPLQQFTSRAEVSNFDVNQSGKLVALEIKGEIFITENDKEKNRTVNVSHHDFRDQEPQWLNDSTLLFVSDRNGQKDIYLVRSADKNVSDIFKSLKHEVIRLTKSSEEESNIVVSNNGAQIAYMQGRGKLLVSDIDSDGKLSNTKVLREGWASADGVTWSPDNRYLAYSYSDLEFNSEIYIHDLSENKPHNVSMHPKRDSRPVWSPDGSKLGFLSNREGMDTDLWFVFLKKNDWEKTKEDHEEGYYAEEKTSKEEKTVNIDFENIYDRLLKVTSLAGGEGNIFILEGGETFYFSAQDAGGKGNNFYSVKWDATEIKELIKGGGSPSSIRMEGDGKLYGNRRGIIQQISEKDGKLTVVSHKANMVLNHPKIREQVFEEAWRALNLGFYDPNFHGNDFKKLKKEYKDWALNASTQQDFRDVFNFMLGQLNASHMGLYGRNPEQTQRDLTGMLGIEFVEHKNGLQISRIISGSPADKENSKLEIGDVITAVNGASVNQGENIYQHLNNTANNQVLLEVKRAGKILEVVIRPTSSNVISDLKYEEWINDKRKLVDQYSGGELGYIHIKGMNMPSFERFERELMASGYGKKGIVIDVRFNGGGWTTDYLMAVLNVKQHAYTVPRGAVKDLQKENKKFESFYPFSERLPLTWLTKPSVALCNSASYSNAEIFSHAYKHLNIGPLVGTPTFGAVISTGGTGLMDDSYVRMPFRAWYVKATGENMEHGPAVPDIIVENKPNSRALNEDEQLKKAVEVLMEKFK